MESSALITKIRNRTAAVGVIGVGYVGLPLAMAYCKAGYDVMAFDIDEEKVNAIQNGDSYIRHLDVSLLSESSNFLGASTDFSRLTQIDCMIICVPTPLNSKNEPDLSYIESTALTISRYLKKGQLVVLESTTYPGTTEDVLIKLLEKSELSAGVDFFVGYSPEREDPNNGQYHTSIIPKIISGYTKTCLSLVECLYSGIVEQLVPVSSTKVAESAKLLENIYRSVNIALVNELKILFEQLDIDIWEVIAAAKTKPFGFQAFYPGPGLGGHCIPVDPFYLSWKAKMSGIEAKFIELAGEINRQMPDYVISRILAALSARGVPITESNLLVLGVAYKKDVDDVRESASLCIIDKLMSLGATVDYHDPYVEVIPKLRKYDIQLRSEALTEASLQKYDAVVVATDHSVYEPKWLYTHAKLIIDTRNIMQVTRDDEKVVKA